MQEDSGFQVRTQLYRPKRPKYSSAFIPFTEMKFISILTSSLAVLGAASPVLDNAKRQEDLTCLELWDDYIVDCLNLALGLELAIEACYTTCDTGYCTCCELGDENECLDDPDYNVSFIFVEALYRFNFFYYVN